MLLPQPKQNTGSLPAYLRYLACLAWLAALLAPAAWAQSPDPTRDDLRFVLAVTEQDPDLEWWSSIPSEARPHINPIGEITWGQQVSILPAFLGYARSEAGKVDLSYDVTITAPDGSEYAAMEGIRGYSKPVTGEYVLPPADLVQLAFKQGKDPAGTYTITVTAHDGISGQSHTEQQQLQLRPFQFAVEEPNFDRWYLEYPNKPRPEQALYYLANLPDLLINGDGSPNWASAWLFKTIYEDNPFLIEPTVDFYQNQDPDAVQQTNIILVLALLGQSDRLPIDEQQKAFRNRIADLSPPDGYSEITTPEQLDVLWAEYFATGKVRPVRQLITALNLMKSSEPVGKIQAAALRDEMQQLAAADDATALRSITFKTALWSINSNLRQSQLFFDYCVFLYQKDQLNHTEGGLLQEMLKRVIQEKQAAARAQ
ncbi:MAG: hypothetical protein E1N59_786 [Puniceicoccaceae bacterium 5H]|nr:MAG: hypothetical protein E1N59_786 [Puniceicoccaceae bacterium 5H]